GQGQDPGLMVLPFGPELLDHEPIGVAEGDLLEISQATLGREQVFAVRVVVAEDVADLAAHGGHPLPEILAMADQPAMLTLPGRGHVGTRDLVPGQKLGQDLCVQAVGLLGALGDDSQFLGIGQYDFLGQGLHELHKPEVAGGGLDDHLEGAELPEELNNLVGLVAEDGLASQDLEVLIQDADGDRLLVKVDADEVHCRVSGSGETGFGKTSSKSSSCSRILQTVASTFPSSHSFNPESTQSSLPLEVESSSPETAGRKRSHL